MSDFKKGFTSECLEELLIRKKSLILLFITIDKFTKNDKCVEIP